MIAPPGAYLDAPDRVFFAASANGVLQLQQCAACGMFQFYPRSVCKSCGGRSLELQASTGTGRVYSFTEVHHALTPGTEPAGLIALVDLDEGVRMLGRLINVDDQEQYIGLRVKVRFWTLDGVTLPCFQPADRPASEREHSEA